MYRPPLVRIDWANHYIWTQAVTVVAFVVALALIPQYAFHVFALGILVAGLYEVAQKITKSGEPSWKDALAGSLGCVFAAIPLLAYLYASLGI